MAFHERPNFPTGDFTGPQKLNTCPHAPPDRHRSKAREKTLQNDAWLAFQIPRSRERRAEPHDPLNKRIVSSCLGTMHEAA